MGMDKPGNNSGLSNEFTGKDEAKEPLIKYGVLKPIKLIVSTLADQDQDNYQYWLTLTPAQRIANVTALIRKIYARQLSEPPKKERIIFDKVGWYGLMAISVSNLSKNTI